MSANIEREKPISEVKEIPEEILIPTEIEKTERVQSVPTQFTQQVQDDSGKPLVSSQSTKKVSIVIPSTDQEVEQLSKGSMNKSITWLANFWRRMMKKALLFGWNVVRDPSKQNT